LESAFGEGANVDWILGTIEEVGLSNGRSMQEQVAAAYSEAVLTGIG